MKYRNPRRAVEVATKATELEPQSYLAWKELGRAQYRAGTWQASIESLQKSVNLQVQPKGGDAGQWIFLAMAHWQLGHHDEAQEWLQKARKWASQNSKYLSPQTRIAEAEAAKLLGQKLSADELLLLARQAVANQEWDEAATDYARAIDQSRDGSTFSSAKKNVCRELAKWDEVFDRLVQLRPEESTLWIGHGQYRVLQSQWAKAAADFAKVVHSLPVSDESTEYAFLLLILDDVQGYQQFCQELVARADKPAAGVAFQMARTLAAGQEDAVDVARVVDWANEAVKHDQYPWDWHVLGLAQYRAGEYDLAIKNLETHLTWNAPETAQNWLVLAMAHHRLGQTDQAQKCLESAQQLIKKVRPKEPDAVVLREDRTALPPTDWVAMNALLHEAKTLIQSPETSQH